MVNKLTLSLIVLVLLSGCMRTPYEYSAKPNDATLKFYAPDMPASFSIRSANDTEFKYIGEILTRDDSKNEFAFVRAFSFVNRLYYDEAREISLPHGVPVEIKSNFRVQSKDALGRIENMSCGPLFSRFTPQLNAHYQVVFHMGGNVSGRGCLMTVEDVTNPAAPVIIPNEAIAAPAV